MKNLSRFSEVVIFLLSAAVLLTAARYSEVFVPKGFARSEFEPSLVEPRDSLYGIDATGERVLWVAGNNGKIVRSDDGGKTWRGLDTSTTKNFQDVAAWDERRAVAVGNDGVVLATEDGGRTWMRIEVPRSEVANKLIRVETRDGGVAWACGVMGTILYTGDYGRSWTRRIEEEDVGFNDIDFLDPDTGVVVAEFGRIKRTADGGDTWEEVESPVESSLMAVDFRPDGWGVAVGLGGNILVSSDRGLSWNRVPDYGAAEHLFDVIWQEDRWVAVGNKGLIVTGSADGTRWEARRLSPNELLWHTGIAHAAGRLFIVGGTQGVLADGRWSALF